LVISPHPIPFITITMAKSDTKKDSKKTAKVEKVEKKETVVPKKEKASKKAAPAPAPVVEKVCPSLLAALHSILIPSHPFQPSKKSKKSKKEPTPPPPPAESSSSESESDSESSESESEDEVVAAAPVSVTAPAADFKPSKADEVRCGGACSTVNSTDTSSLVFLRRVFV
jgi:hypothetical protein